MAGKRKKIAVIGAGFTGLSTALKLAEEKFEVTIFEKENLPGGLAIGFKEKGWRWPLEKHYHHIFTSDKYMIKLAEKVGDKILFSRPKTAMYLNQEIWQLDSLSSLLAFPYLSIVDRVRTGIVLASLRVLPFWKSLEGQTAEHFLNGAMGQKSWQVLWEPLFVGKFGKYANEIPASWFWARIKKRSASLGYPEGGFETLALKVAKKVSGLGGKFIYKTGIQSVEKKGEQFLIITDQGKQFYFDGVISTLPTPLFIKTVKDLPESYVKSLIPLKGLGAVNVVLFLKESFLQDGTYWLNINDREMPFLSLVEHTNLIDKKNYRGDNIIYVGNYLPADHPYFSKDAQELLNIFMPSFKKINPKFEKKLVKKAFVFKATFAQPIIPLNYSQILPKIETPVKGLYLANIQQVYPWDRGTNYAVELGERVAKKISHGF